MKNGIKKAVRGVKVFLGIGRGDGQRNSKRSDLDEPVPPDEEDRVILSKVEYRKLVEDLEYWRVQADHLLDEIEYLSSRNPKN